MTDYTGRDWPSEPLAEQREALRDGQYHVLICGEAYDIIDIEIIVKSLSFVRKYGKPFSRLYGLVRHRFSKDHSAIRWEVPFHYASLTLSEHRIEVLRMLLDACRDSALYEIVHKDKDGSLIVERNFPDYVPGELNATLEATLRANGWTEPTGKPLFAKVEEWQERKKLGRNAPLLSIYRLFRDLSHIWKEKRSERPKITRP